MIQDIKNPVSFVSPVQLVGLQVKALKPIEPIEQIQEK
jgi:hypothetical protein